jgi:hypothetical protein
MQRDEERAVMSDPAKSADEIEDVLASIRRLVSESGAPGGSAKPSSAGKDKLVLTPSLRVTEPDDPWAPVPSASETADAETAEAQSATRDSADDDDPAWGLEDRLSDWGEIEESADEAVADAIAESGANDDAPHDARSIFDDVKEAEDAFDLSGIARLDGLDEDAGEVAVFEAETGDVDWPDRGADAALRDLAAARSGQSTHAEPSTVSEDTAADLMPAESDPLEADSVAADTVTADAAPEALTGSEPSRDEALAAAQSGDSLEPEAESQMIETDATDAVEEDTASDESVTRVFSRRMGTRSPVEPVESELDDGVEDLGEDPSPFTFPDADEGILDEETLREIVADVVREELQGALGQRITRNVRKMVRREIRIALAAEDLE